ncbi:protein of unknown function DUF2721 [Gottschalkia purinilytica]|uniref:DUF2721 domain-containing protein n=1 Tax=Gottschalkia purinilytica TaxID=1503 RepID=A0A0L0W901_GOTPU|nr:DUF2721 domain-containing protein [Gottschalkia purinilytica]KNF07785.1 protein of unknown function DUF2721 [Gottschalkia purinilytica]
MKLTLTTPALLFPAISLLLLAYTNRFLVLAELVRKLYDKHKEIPDEKLSEQIDNLKKRIRIIRNMQVLGVLSFFLCVFSMFMIFQDRALIANITFGLALILLMSSLALSIKELTISIHALNIQLSDCEEK